jgi:hypothetical protein
MAKRFKRATEVQSLLFDKSKWSITAAKKWLSSHKHRVPKAESSGDYHRFRQRPPFQFQKGTFRTITLGRDSNGIKAVIAVPRAASSSPKRNPRKANPRTASGKKKSRIPALMVDLADARAIELEDGRELKFKLAGKFALCANKKGDELWIMSRKGGKRVATADQQAEQLFEKFTGFEAEDTGALVQLPGLTLERIGRAMSIIYRSDKFSTRPRDYIHAFKAYPTVSVDSLTRPRIVALRGGRIKVTAEGITG